jgi:hypothetical protein
VELNYKESVRDTLNELLWNNTLRLYTDISGDARSWIDLWCAAASWVDLVSWSGSHISR